MAQGLDALTREELVELLEITAKDLIALDGTWFQSLEREQGMDTAMEHDRAAWRRFVPSEARRLKKLLDLSDRCGLGDSPRRCLCAAPHRQTNGDSLGGRRGRARLPHHGLPRAERPRAQGNGVPPLQERGRIGIRRLRRRPGRPHPLRVRKLLSRRHRQHLQLRLALPDGGVDRAPFYLNRFSRRELLTTLTLERAMAAPARAGARMPTAASGIMMQL